MMTRNEADALEAQVAARINLCRDEVISLIEQYVDDEESSSSSPSSLSSSSASSSSSVSTSTASSQSSNLSSASSSSSSQSVAGNTIEISGYYEFDELRVPAGTTLVIHPGAELVRRDVAPDPLAADGGIWIEDGAHIRAVRLPTDPPILIRSANPTGQRGHLLIVGTAEIDRATIVDFGRSRIEPWSATNIMGRYALHFHGAGDNGRVSRVENCEIYDTVLGYRHGIVIHATNGVTCRKNTVRGKAGSGIYLEDGTETDNLIEDNLIEDISGTALRPDGRGMADLGHEGAGIWLRNPSNRVRRNTVRRCAFGYMYFLMHAPEAAQTSHVLEFADNAAERCQRALEYWWIGGYQGDKADGMSVFDRFRATDCDHGIYGYQGGDIQIRDGKLLRCRWGFDAGDYLQRRLSIVGTEFIGGDIGILPSSNTVEPMLIDSCQLNNKTDVYLRMLYHNNDARILPPRRVVLRNCELNGPTQIEMYYQSSGQINWVQLDEVLVEGAENFQVYYREQAPGWIVPQSSPDGRQVGCPEAGLTNEQAWAKYGIAIAGAVAPCGATRDRIKGLVC